MGRDRPALLHAPLGCLYYLLLFYLPPKVRTIPGSREQFRQALDELGPMTGSEKRLLAFCLLALSLWATEGILHPLDSSTVMVVVLGLMLLPGVGAMRWRQAEQHVRWGAVGLVGIRISLGTVLLSSQAAAWLADKFFAALGIGYLSLLLLVAAITVISTTVHLAFASTTALSSVLVPIVIGLLQQLNLPNITLWWVILINQFSISVGFVFRTNAPQNMVAYASGTFTTHDFLRVGVPLTLAAYVMLLLFTATYWRWLGLR